MSSEREYEFPPEVAEKWSKARRLEIISLIYTASAAVALFVTMRSSQAMRTSFYEDVMSLVPAAMFLITSRIAPRAARRDYPFGYHRAVSIGYLAASLALLAMGSFLLIEATTKLLHAERVTIGGINLFGKTIWAGWPMLAALLYTGIPSFFLGRAKMKIAPELHDKILYADAKMMKADWMAEAATAVGVIGVGFGIWWADPLAAILVSIDILHDGISNVGIAIHDLMDRRPRKTTHEGEETLPEELARLMQSLDWVEAVEVRMREEGHVFFGDIFVVPRSTERMIEHIEQAMEHARALNWRIHDVTITPVERLPGRTD